MAAVGSVATEQPAPKRAYFMGSCRTTLLKNVSNATDLLHFCVRVE